MKKNISDALAMEEYKFAKEKIRKNEERRYQMLVLNITAFGLILGLSDKIEHYAIPIGLLIILMICLDLCKSQTRIQYFTTAYIIENYEVNHDFIEYESTGRTYIESKGNRSKFKELMSVTMRVLFNPFFLLMIVEVFAFFFFGIEFIIAQFNETNYLVGFIYIIFILGGHMKVLKDLIDFERIRVDEYRAFWVEKMK